MSFSFCSLSAPHPFTPPPHLLLLLLPSTSPPSSFSSSSCSPLYPLTFLLLLLPFSFSSAHPSVSFNESNTIQFVSGKCRIKLIMSISLAYFWANDADKIVQQYVAIPRWGSVCNSESSANPVHYCVMLSSGGNLISGGGAYHQELAW